jgi:exodeoxyribonuclease VII large subunit
VTTYLKTQYRDRQRVKDLGARFDGELRQWYVPSGRDLAPFAQWLPAAAAPASVEASHALAQPPATQRGVSLSQLLAGVAAAVAQSFAEGVWTRLEVIRADIRAGGHVYLEVAERDAGGTALAQARALMSKNEITANLNE